MTIRKNKIHTKFLVSAASVLAIGFAAPAMGQAAETAEFDIPSQSLSSALIEYSRQSNVTVIAPTAMTDGLVSTPVSGALAPDAALETLLSNAKLEMRKRDDGVIILSQAIAEAPERRPGPFRVAQVSQEETIRDVGGRVEDEESVQDVIVVTGTNIRGVENIAVPSLTLSRDELEIAGFSSIEEAFQTLPQNLNSINDVGTAVSGASNVGAFNAERAAGINLRGLGTQSTLVLLNGKRRPGVVQGRVFDVSAIPLSAVQQVEIVTGGRSAVYGSDAVAGVVNIVMRRDFEGAESQAFASMADDGAERLNLSQIVGAKFSRGGVVAAYDFARDRDLDITEAGRVNTDMPGFNVPTPGEYDLTPDNWRHSALLSGNYDVSDSTELYFDGLYTFDKNKQNASFSLGAFPISSSASYTSEQYSLAGGLKAELGGDWEVDVSGVYGVSDVYSSGISESIFTGSLVTTDDNQAELWSVSAVADGPLMTIAGVEVRAAIGVETRSESFEREVLSPAIFFQLRGEEERDVQSVFAELLLPIVEDGAQPGLRELQVSFAGRYDDYSDFGDTFNPQAGLVWSPMEGLRVRGAYSEAFRAPDLFTLTSATGVQLRTLPDPMTPPIGFSTVLTQIGVVPDLGPEDATTWSVGFDYEPGFAPWLTTSASFYSVEYEDRIDTPAVGTAIALALVNQTDFQSLIDRSPTAQQLSDIVAGASTLDNFSGIPFDFQTQNLLDVFPGLVLFDNRTANIGIDKTSGIDIQLRTQFEMDIGKISAGLNVNHILDFDRQVTETSPEFSQLNEPGKPVDTRLRGDIGWSKDGVSTVLFVNYTDSYANTLLTPNQEMDAFVTVDATLGIDGSQMFEGGFLDGTRLTLNATNLFNEDPPLLNGNNFSFNFDGINANPLGRVISARIVKRW